MKLLLIAYDESPVEPGKDVCLARAYVSRYTIDEAKRDLTRFFGPVQFEVQ